MLAIVKAFFSRLTLPGLPWLLALAFTLGFSSSWYLKNLQASKQELKVVERVVTVERKSAEVSAKVDQKHTEAVAKVRTITKTILKEVPVYVTQKVDANCTIPVGFVSVFNASANGEVPPAPGTVNESAASEVVLSEVATAAVENHGSYHEVAQQLRDLQSWIRQQGEVYGAK